MDSKLQIISGEFRGRKLRLPVGARPTQNRARIALFNVMQSMGLQPGMVWDAFAGSGAFGIECLSRWPECNAVFSDLAPTTVRGNLAAMNIGARATVVTGDAMSHIDRYGAAADLIFVDPPYADADVGAAFVKSRRGCAAGHDTYLGTGRAKRHPARFNGVGNRAGQAIRARAFSVFV